MKIKQIVMKMIGYNQKSERMSVNNLELIGKNWESLAQYDPMWAILSDPKKKGNKWDINDFLMTGEREIGDLISYFGNSLKRKGDRLVALDFGCGMGRLSLALAQYYEEVIGIDISETMINLANQILDGHSSSLKGRVTYRLNNSNSIPIEDNKCDLIYSNIVLQHMNIDDALFYITEFVRVLKRDGLAVFQAPSRCLTERGSLFKTPIADCDEGVTIDMNLIPRKSVIKAVNHAGGKVIEIQRDYSAGPKFESYKYFVSK
ncbi:MAG: hypothetical protein A2Z47_04170 [Thermodesulfovibrio sp. RBG_19FT_COMBO_42_12]|nr:MAG: hypothetical protein A2Z47_04170 [Thermodesulfovibrio sp. RBG_19FT_COMBO_42_12]